jgi:RNA polymerase sigma factor (TIGR02999 family)
LRSERANHTLQPTALVHEVCLRLLRDQCRWEDREHLIRLAGKCMRQILVDYARSKEAQKRGGSQSIISLEEAGPLAQWCALSSEDLLALDAALTKLHSFDERQASIVELRFFAGLTEEEIAVMLGVVTRTVKRDWESARAWLRGQLRPGNKVGKLDA